MSDIEPILIPDIASDGATSISDGTILSSVILFLSAFVAEVAVGLPGLVLESCFAIKVGLPGRQQLSRTCLSCQISSSKLEQTRNRHLYSASRVLPA